jgi:hypothetical protein
MKENITLDNYEAFYLDYLEGNLSLVEQKAFEAFLAQHPHLAVDGDELPVLIPPAKDEQAQASTIDVFALQQSIDLAELNTENVDFYLIAQEEGLLSDAQSKELFSWLVAHPSYQADATLMQHTRFKNEVLIYPNKHKLVQKEARIIPLWWAGAAALAAGIALIITFGWNTNERNNTNSIQPTFAQKHNQTKQNEDQAPSFQNNTNNGNQQSVPSNQKDRTENRLNVKDHFNTAPIIAPIVSPSNEKEQLAQENKQHTPKPNIDGILPPNIPSPNRIGVIEESNTKNNDLAILSLDDMRNPIEPITEVLSEKLNTTIDFRSAKSTADKKGGFFLKIGKLEVSHKGSKR